MTSCLFHLHLKCETDLVWHFLQTVQRSDVIQCIYGRRQASVKAENLQDEEAISINLDIFRLLRAGFRFHPFALTWESTSAVRGR